MVDLIAWLASTPPSGTTSHAIGDPDWFARVIAGAAWITTIVLFLVQHRGKVWQGRLNSTKDLRSKFDEVRTVISSIEQDRANAVQLWTITTQERVDTLRDAAKSVPDKKLCKMLVELVTEIDTARGASQPTDEEAAAPTLSARRHSAVKKASTKADEVVERLNEIQRKGAIGG